MSSFEEQIKETINKIIDQSDNIAIPYFKELEGSTKQRIHNKGLDSNNQTIGIKNKRKGRYSPGYEKRKEKIVGNNIYPINLQLSGDLLRSFTVGIESGRPVLKFQDQFNSNKAVWNEKNFNTEIYKPTQQQLDDANEILKDSIKDFLSEVLN